MGIKEDGMLTGTMVFGGIWAGVALILGQYVYSQTKDRSAAAANR